MKRYLENFTTIYFLVFISFFSIIDIQRYNIFILIILIGIGIIIGNKLIIKEKFYFLKSIIALIIIYSFQFILSKFRYEQSIIQVISCSMHFYLLFAYFVYKTMIKSVNDVIVVEKIIVKFSAILSTLFILQFLIYSKYGVFLKVPIGIRNGTLRITAFSIFTNIGLIISLFNILKKSQQCKKINIYNFIVSLIYLVVIQKTRSILMIMIVSIFIGIIFFLRKRNTAKMMIFLSIVISVMTIYLVSESADKFYNSIGMDYGVMARNGAIEYYINGVKEKPLLGIGFINYGEREDLDIMLTGEQGIYYRDDVGIIGLLHTLGIIGIIWYVLLLYKIGKMLFNLADKRNIDSSIEFITIYSYILFSSFNVIILDPQRIAILPVVLAMIEAIYINRKDISNNKLK